MAKSYNPRIKGVHDKPPASGSKMSFSHPTYNYLGHFKQEKFMSEGHNDSGDLGSVGLDPHEVEKFQNGFKGAMGGGLVTYSSGGNESAPAPKTVSHDADERGRAGGLSNKAYQGPVRITTK